jgi:hypothetical protein
VIILADSERPEKRNVREAIIEYFRTHQGYRFKEFGNFKKTKLGGNTWIYLVETKMEDGLNLALVTVNRAFVQGIFILNSDQVAKIVKALIDGLEDPF